MFGSIRLCLSNKPCLSSLMLKPHIYYYQSNSNIPKTCISETLIKRTFFTRKPCMMITLLARSYSSRPPRPRRLEDPNVYAKEFKKSRGASNTALYILSFIVFFVGVSYASVPLYRMFCAETGYGGMYHYLRIDNPRAFIFKSDIF